MGVVTPDRLGTACAAWQELLGSDAVITEPGVLSVRARTTLPRAPSPVAVLQPATRAQVPAVVAIAARAGLPLYPISRGRNWGWGDACPPTPGQVVLDLSRLTGVEVDEFLGVAVVEPGVSQHQLAERLLPTAWVADCTAAGPDVSVLGSILERGTGKSSLGERWANVLAVEAVLADSTVVRTGFWDDGDVRAAHALRWGLGPALDGLFAQSNFGIVTRAVVALAPRSPDALALCLSVPDDLLPTAFDRLRELRLSGVPTGAPHGFPLQRPGQPRRWLVTGQIAGTRRIVAAAEADLVAALGGFSRVACFPPDATDRPDALDGLIDRLGLPPDEVFREFLAAAATFARGWPMTFSPEFVLRYVGGAEGQGKIEPPATADPLAEGYGFWFAWPVASSEGSEVRRLVDFITGTLERHGRPLTLTLASPNPRTVVGVTRVCFDRDDPFDTAAAEVCYVELLRAAGTAGFPLARASITDMVSLDGRSSAHWSLVRRLKAALDPEDILAPGRYVPAPPR